MTIGIIQNFIELLYAYKQSSFYSFHIIMMGVFFSIYLLCIIKQRQIANRQNNPPQSKCSQKIDYVDYHRTVKQNTAREVSKLQNSQQYKRYLQMISDPRYRARKSAERIDDDDIIVFSDQEQPNQNQKTRKAKMI